ncbi:UNVERIFIED_CONTAM: hypothetical protein FKN15_004822 [Acipenser sinensis]
MGRTAPALPRTAQGCLLRIAWGCLLLIAWGCLLLRIAWGCLLLRIAWGCLLLRIAWGCLLLRIAWSATSYRERGRSGAPAAASMARGSPPEFASAPAAISLQEKGWPEPHGGELPAMKKGGQVWRPPPKFFWPEEPACAWSTGTLQLLGWEEDIPPWPHPEISIFPCSWAGTASRDFRE